MIIAVAAAVHLSLARGADTQVTYMTRAARAETVLPELGKLAGVDLQAAKETANEILVISVKNTPLSDILPRIATVTSSEWKQDGPTLRLVPNRELRRNEDAQETAKRTSDIKHYIALRRQIQTKGAEAIRQQKKEQATKTDSRGKDIIEGVDIPDERRSFAAYELATQLLDGIGSSPLASVDDRVVFATSPNSKQRSLGDAAIQAISDFIKIRNGMVPAKTPEFDQDADVARTQKTEYLQKVGPIGRVEKVLLVAEPADRDVQPSALKFSIRFFDAKGNVVFEFNDTLCRPETDGVDAVDNFPKIPYTADSNDFVRAVGYFEGGADRPFPARLLPKLLQPLSYDPLSYYQTDEVMAYAKAKGKPLIADLPDDWGSDRISLLADPEPASLLDIEQDLKDGISGHDVGDAQFTVVKPSRPVHSRSIRVGRRSIVKLIANGEAKGVASSDDLYEFASANSFVRPTGMMLAYLSAIVPPMEQFRRVDYLVLSLYSSLSKEQRSAAHGLKLPTSSMSEGQLAALDRLLYQVPGLHSANRSDPIAEGIGEDYRSEPTEVAPNGIPADAFIEIQTFHEPTVFPVDPSGMHGVLSVSDLVLSQEPLPAPENGRPAVQTRTAVGLMRIGKITQFDFVLRLPRDAAIGCVLGDFTVNKDSNVFTASNLPPNLAKIIVQQQKNNDILRNALSSQAKVTIPP